MNFYNKKLVNIRIKLNQYDLRENHLKKIDKVLG